MQRLAAALESLLDDSATEDLSRLLPRALRIARECGDEGFASWLRLELEGYYGRNPAQTDNTEVPKYRTIPGIYRDHFGRRLVVPSSLQFLNETRLRNAVGELERLLASGGTRHIDDPSMNELIREHLHVEVGLFEFDTSAIAGVLDAIRSNLLDRLYALRSHLPSGGAVSLTHPQQSVRGRSINAFLEHEASVRGRFWTVLGVFVGLILAVIALF
jgi:hypothetical protein